MPPRINLPNLIRKVTEDQNKIVEVLKAHEMQLHELHKAIKALLTDAAIRLSQNSSTTTIREAHSDSELESSSSSTSEASSLPALEDD